MSLAILSLDFFVIDRINLSRSSFFFSYKQKINV